MSALSLKLLALFSMVLDHVGAVLLPEAVWPRVVGRLAFPLYAFLLGQGFAHTRDRRRYLFRLVLFAVISEVPYDLCFSGSVLDLNRQNVFFTLALGLAALWGYEYFSITVRRTELGLLAAAAAAVLAQALGSDYGLSGVIMILLLYLCREEKRKTVFFFLAVGLQAVTLGLTNPAWGAAQLWAGFAILPILLYSGKPGRRKLRWFFYLSYPVHLLLLWLLSPPV